MQSKLEVIRSLDLSKLSDEDLAGYGSYINKVLNGNFTDSEENRKNLQIELCYIIREAEYRRNKIRKKA